MKKAKQGFACGVALAASLALAAPTWAQDEKKADEGGKVTISGQFDGYYQYSFNHPPTGSNLGGRSFDIKNDQFALSLLEINVIRTASKEVPIGLTFTGTLGKTADLVHATEPGGMNTYKYIQQLYGTYVKEGKTPITIDFGKFVTWTGLEVIESTGNDNYSRGLLFTYAIPLYHMGVRVTAPVGKATLGLYLVNGWNDVEDDNGGKTIGASLNFAPSSKLNIILNYIGGDESTAAALPANLNTQVFDGILIYNATPKLKLALNVDYASASKSGFGGGNWNGQAAYLKYQFTPSNAFALRAEHFEDSNGLRTGTAQNLNGITATFEHVWKSSLVTRIEFRHDHAGTAFFPSGGGGSKDQDSISLSHVVKF